MKVSSIIPKKNNVVYQTVEKNGHRGMVRVWHDGTTKRALIVSDDTLTLIILLHRYFYECSDV